MMIEVISRHFLALALIAVSIPHVRSQACESYSGSQCVGYGDVLGGQNPTVEMKIAGTVDLISVPWFKKGCKAAIRKIACATSYEALSCSGTTFCESDCVALAEEECEDYLEEPSFNFAISSLCSNANSSSGCTSSELDFQLLEADEPSCPNPLGVRPDHLDEGQSFRPVPSTACAFPCLNVLFTEDDQRMVREFGVTMSVLSFVFCTVGLWVFLTQPDIARRKSTSTPASSKGSRRSLLPDINFRESLRQVSSSLKAGRFMIGYSKAQIWKIALFMGAWFNAFVSMIYDCADIQSPVGCDGKIIILEYHSMAVFKAMVNFWVHFFSILIMGYLSRNLYLSSLGMSEVGPRVEREFSRMLGCIVAASLLIVIICAAVGQYGFDFGVSAAFMMQTKDRDPLFVIIALLGFLNVAAGGFVIMFLYNVPFRAVPKSARMLVASFLLYFGISIAFIVIAIYVFGVYAEIDSKPAVTAYTKCLLSHTMSASTSPNAGIHACGSYADDNRIPIGMLMYFKLWQSGYSTVTLLAWAPVIGRRIYAVMLRTMILLRGGPDTSADTPRVRKPASSTVGSNSEKEHARTNSSGVDNDFTRIARTVRKRWDAVKTAVSTTATGHVVQDHNSVGVASVEEHDNEFDHHEEDDDADEEFQELPAGQIAPEQDAIDGLFKGNDDNEAGAVAMQTFSSAAAETDEV